MNSPLVSVIHKRERITTNSRKVSGELQHFENQQKYFNILTESEIKELTYRHCVKMADLYIMVEGNTAGALKYLFKAVKLRPFALYDYVKIILVLLKLYRPLRKLNFSLKVFWNKKVE